MMKKFRKAQITLEYVIILAAIVGAIIVVAGALKTKIGGDGGIYSTLSTKMSNKMSSNLF